MTVYFEYPSYLIIVAVITAAVVSFLLYYKDRLFVELQKWKRLLMTCLRFVFVLIILLLLLNPIFKSSAILIQKPIIVFVQDNSRSIVLNSDSTFYKNEYKQNVKSLLKSIEDTYDVKYLQFSDITSNDSILDYSGEITDISSVFPEVISRFSGMNLGAVILATDGIYNKGVNPAYNNNIDFPVYSIALGDTITQKDLILKDIMHNKVAFLGNRFPLKVFINAEKCSEKESEINIYRDDKIVYSAKFNIPENSTSTSLEIEIYADKLGIQQYEIELKHLKDEISYENNQNTFVVNVIDNRNKILLLANSPHPDLGALKFALKDNPDFELEIQYINDLKANIKDYDLIILHQIPSIQNSATGIFSEIEKYSIPTLFILGSSSSLDAFNALKVGLEIKNMSKKTDDATPSFNSSFSAFSPGVDTDVFFKNLSPLKVFFGDYTFQGESKILLYQNINGVKTSKPLIAIIENNKTKTGIITGEGIWKWRIEDYKYNSEHTGFTTLINRIIQYIIVRRIQDKLSVETKQVFNENEPLILNASFYNEAYELVPDMEVILKLTNKENKEFKYNFSSFGNSYRLDLGRLPVDIYHYSAVTKFENKEYTASGEFIVQKINIEALVTTADHNILYRLAELSGGKVFYPDDMNTIPKVLEDNSDIANIAYNQEKLHTITDLIWMFFTILLFASTEWILRKYWGGY
ncbi:MAG TPA: hypothetical protein PLL66_00545 [Bacteroidales bacterium]|nr:hypothetical protein [Bacteroidales bacterium]